MNRISQILGNRNAIAWLLLVSAVAVHVFDETMTDFLPFYNGLVLSLRERLAFFPAPTFTFELWLGGLIAAIILGYTFTVLVARGGKVVRSIVIILGVLMIANALGHLLGSLYAGRLLPGVWSSPLLLAAASFVVFRGLRGDWKLQATDAPGTAAAATESL